MVAIGAACVSGNQEPPRLGIKRLAHALPPPPDTLHGEGGGVVVGADTYPRFILANIVNPIGVDPTQLAVDEVVDPYLLGLSLGPKLTAAVLERPDQFFLLGIH
jgi:hypothetical protein